MDGLLFLISVIFPFDLPLFILCVLISSRGRLEHIGERRVSCLFPEPEAASESGHHVKVTDGGPPSVTLHW